MKDLLRHKWALAESYFNRMYPVFMGAIQFDHSLGKKKTMEDHLISIESMLAIADDFTPAIDTPHSEVNADGTVTFSGVDSSGLPTARVNGKNIALIPVIGPLTKYGDLCSMGMQDYANLLNRANASASIDGIVLIMDTPGGTVDGTPEFGLTIKSSKKPVGIFGDGMVASAGLWLASQASVIVGNKNNPTEFGSIGVLMALPNYQNMMEAGNYPKVEIFRASQSTEKAQVNPIEPITDQGRKDLQDELDSTASDFISTVKAGRGDKLDVHTPGLFNGRMFSVADAKRIGLIDSVGTLQTAVNKVAELAKAKAKQATEQQTGITGALINQGTNPNANMKFPKISSLFGSRSKEAKEVTMKVTSEGLQSDDNVSLEAAEEKVAGMEADVTRLKAEGEEKDKTIASLTASVAEQKTQIETLTASETKLTAELAKKPTGNVTTILTDPKQEGAIVTDPNAKKEEANKFGTSIDAEAKAIREALYPSK